MSEFIAEAQVLILPNTAKFAASLRKQVEAAVATAGPVTIPVVAAPVAPGAGASQKALAADTALATGAIEAEDAALRKLVVGQELSGVASAQSAARLKSETVQRGQATRAIEAQAASLVGVRGAVLTASTPFLLATAAVITFSKSIKEASSETEELNKTAVVFGSSAKQIEEFSKTTARSLGISSTEALKSAGIFGNLFRTLKIGEKVSADMSEQLVTLASDLASFNNADPSRVLEALRSGLVGQARPLRVFGIFISQARAQQEALIETGKKNIKELTNAQLVQARYNIILADSGLAQGDFERTSGRLANQSRILKAEISDLGVELGRVLIPALTLTIQGINDFIGDINETVGVVTDLTGDIGSLAQEIAKSSPANFVINIITKVPGGGEVGDAFKKIKAELEIAAGAAAFTTGAAFSELGIGIPVAAAGIILLNKGLHDFNAEAKQVGTDSKQAVKDLFDEFKRAGEGKQAFDGLITGLSALEAKLSTGDAFSKAFARGILRLIIQLRALGDNPKVEDIGKAIADAIARGFNTRAFVITNAVKSAVSVAVTAAQHQVDVLTQKREQIAAGVLPGGKSAEETVIGQLIAAQQNIIDTAKVGSKAYRDALREKARLMGELATLQKQDAADTKATASSIAQDQATATQAFIDAFSSRRQRLQNALTSADLFGTAKQQIAANKALLIANKAEITAIRARIRSLHLHGDALKAAQAEIARLIQENFNTANAIIQLQRARKQTIADARQSHLEAQLSIAETTASSKDDRAAQKALISFDQAQIRRILAIKRRRRLTLEEAAQLDAYRVDLAQRNAALKKTTEETNTAGSLFFKFLQTQQGFAANLLGNLIPGFATKGLVGNSAQTAAGGDGLRQVAGGFEQPRGVQGQAALAASRDRGVRPVQVDTTNQLLRQILRSLQNLNGRASSPEARYQNRVAGSNMDTIGGV